MSIMKTNRVGYVLVLLTFAMIVFSQDELQAGDNKWTSAGPSGGSIESLTFHPTSSNVVFALTRHESFASRNGGQSWVRMSLPKCHEVISFFSVYRILPILRVYPQTPNAVLAGCNSIYRSTDMGATWRSWSEIPNGFISDFEFDPRSPDVINAATGTVYGRHACEVYKSSDGGKTWSKKLSGSSCDSSQIEVDPNNPNLLYSWIGKKFYTSTTSGESWQVVSQQISGDQLVLDPSNRGVLYAIGKRLSKPERGLFKSENGGKNWELIQKGADRVSINPVNRTEIITISGEKFSRSIDAGKTFSLLTIPQEANPVNVAIHPNLPRRIFFADANLGVFRSTDSGASWKVSNKGIDMLDIDQVAVNSHRPDQIFARAGGRLFQSSNAGVSWKVVLLNDGNHFDVEIHKKNPNLIVTNSILSDDSGRTWKEIKYPNHLLASHDPADMALHPTDEKIIYSAGGRYGVLKSTDRGITWKQMNSGTRSGQVGAGPICIDPNNGFVLYVVANFNQLYKSINGGEAWKRLNWDGGDIWSLSIDPDNSQVLFAAAGDNGIHRSTNSGATWELKLANPYGASFVNASLPNSQTVFAGIFNESLIVSPNNGDNWNEFDRNGFPVDFVIRDLAFSSVKPNALYLATSRGVFSYTRK